MVFLRHQITALKTEPIINFSYNCQQVYFFALSLIVFLNFLSQYPCVFFFLSISVSTVCVCGFFSLYLCIHSVCVCVVVVVSHPAPLPASYRRTQHALWQTLSGSARAFSSKPVLLRPRFRRGGILTWWWCGRAKIVPGTRHETWWRKMDKSDASPRAAAPERSPRQFLTLYHPHCYPHHSTRRLRYII